MTPKIKPLASDPPGDAKGNQDDPLQSSPAKSITRRQAIVLGFVIAETVVVVWLIVVIATGGHI
jgi:hypothetical protein